MLLVTAHARAQPRPQPTAAEPERDFWREVTDPNGDEVRALITKARRAMSQPDDALSGDTEWAVEQRARFYTDAYNLLRYARKLAPENVEVLAQLARAADELGKTREAIDALEAAVRVTGPDKAGPEVAGRLGAIYLRLGDRETAIRWLRLAQGALSNREHACALVHLSNALAAQGEPAAAIHLLANALPDQAVPHYGPELTLVAFSLAVQFDRDEQPAAAFEVIDHMQTTMQAQYDNEVRDAIARLGFAPAEDLHYYRGLLYESLGHFVEARAEWSLYAASDGRWRGRALDHIEAIDRLRRARATKPATTSAPPRGIPRKLPRP